MKKRLFFAIAFAVIFALGNMRTHAADTFTVTLWYYDNIQLTYTVNYPGGGTWSGNADVPIGHAVGTTRFSQVFCVDPFVSFHAMAVSTWDYVRRTTMDTKTGYVIAAPWTGSPALMQNRAAVDWLITNGFRGEYLEADNAEALASVSRLNNLLHRTYPDLTLTRRAAFMATKVAIWDVLAPGGVTLLDTSLANPGERAAFNALHNLLVSYALGDRPNLGPLATAFEVFINAETHILDNVIPGYNLVGPIMISASTLHAADVHADSLSGVFLSISGENTSGVMFSDVLGNVFSPEAIWGVAESAQFVPGSGFTYFDAPDGTSDGLWVSNDIFLRVPVGQSADNLTILAQARIRDVHVLHGTPVYFVFAMGGVHDWQAVQAFGGAAGDNAIIDMFAETRSHTGVQGLGKLFVSKAVENATPLDLAHEFVFQILYSYTSNVNDAVPLHFDASHPLHGAAVGGSGTTFTLTSGQTAFVESLPLDRYYWVEEISGGAFDTRHIVYGYGEMPGSRTSYIRIESTDGYGQAAVAFINTSLSTAAQLHIGKVAFSITEDGEQDFVRDVSFNFLLERSDDGETWDAAQLYGIFLREGQPLGVPQSYDERGHFSLRTFETAFVSLNTSYQYRVTELNVAPSFSPLYAAAHYQYLGAGSWAYPPVITTNIASANWLREAGVFSTTNLTPAAQDQIYLAFVNVDVPLFDMQLSKEYVGADVDITREFRFQVMYLAPNLGIPTPTPLPFVDDIAHTVDADGTVHAGFVRTGGGRVCTDDNTVLVLHAQETATIHGLPAGSFQVRELSTGYYPTYSIDDAQFSPANDGVTETFLAFDNTHVHFINRETLTPVPVVHVDVPEEPAPDEPADDPAPDAPMPDRTDDPVDVQPDQATEDDEIIATIDYDPADADTYPQDTQMQEVLQPEYTEANEDAAEMEPDTTTAAEPDRTGITPAPQTSDTRPVFLYVLIALHGILLMLVSGMMWAIASVTKSSDASYMHRSRKSTVTKDLDTPHVR